MHCPFCTHDDTRVVDSRVVEDGSAVRRRRHCDECGKRFSSFERAELRLPLVIKKDGTRVAFNIEKVRDGMQKSLEKRPVSADDLEKSVHSVLKAVQESNENEISAETIGDFVMEQLRNLDGVAYVRFSSVYREFKDVDEFLTAVRAAIGTQK
ncbi:MAG: transcriptional regulator NrdR [Ghiorsea sp.]|nr:transcriptional regulator NrdR [Ghiorsea sp.]MDQ6981226.1 transcriptional regulator NrdR [Ghiorsea sp.]MDQ7057676.1 transcriptional regulator NrdR [Ghiorsea sp.]